MTLRLRPVQWILVASAAIFGGFIVGVNGLLAGATYGGNFCSSPCEFNGQVGYEATGLMGLYLGAGVGFVLSAWGAWALLRWRNTKKAHSFGKLPTANGCPPTTPHSSN